MQIVQIDSSAKEVVSKKYLEINNCGLCTDMTTPIKVDKPEGRKDYHFVYIVDGTMYFELGGRRMDLGAGNLVIFKPGEAQIYGSYDEDVVSYYWAHFSGTCVEDMLEDCGLSDAHYYFIDVDPGICKALNMIIKEYTYGEYCYKTKCNALFIMLFAEMARLTDHALKSDGKYEILLPAIKAMEQNYSVWYKNEEYAKMCGISKYHFIHLFTECKGCSPSKYKSNILMQKATELLSISDIPMNEIADMLGFEDALYFSKKFKSAYGMSPSQYRQKFGK
jgi:AraC-like DNA-binding protein